MILSSMFNKISKGNLRCNKGDIRMGEVENVLNSGVMKITHILWIEF